MGFNQGTLEEDKEKKWEIHLVEVEETLGVNNIVVSWNLNQLELVFKVKGDSLVVGDRALLDGEKGGDAGFRGGGDSKEEKREKQEEERLHC